MRKTRRLGMVRAFAASAGVLLLAALAGCAPAGGPAAPSGSTESTPSPTETGPTGTVTVYAAASLTETFTQLAEEFEADHPGVTVTLNFGGSSTLAEQIVTGGAPVDVFASASDATMKPVVDAGLVEWTPATFTRNALVIVTPEGNPAGITGLKDFADPKLKIALCDEEVPCGAAAAKIFEQTDIVPQPDTLESDVKAVLTKVSLGEVDAGLVYATDAKSAALEVDPIEFPEALDAVNNYGIVPLKAAPNPEAAAAFTEFILTARGVEVFEEAGFLSLT
ncbi:molybdate ABC transporter substrate-binding protein [Pseudoclavibacter sp. AY1F1]|uniref:molybdate ABC transporter substrate-binding protein n=1 Tax=Pseudoclavibacter sp. AY1F1 TaxID=2080583 RepID=UPI0021582B0F|nr:molybdate ABC transporter substrate-binding protein [Pseudoclavibacter sp. AY1F1]